MNCTDPQSPTNLEKKLLADACQPGSGLDTLARMHIELGCIFVEYVREFRALFGISFKESFSGEPLIGVEVKGAGA